MFRQMPFGTLCHEPGLTIVRGDAREVASLEPLVRKADVVIPLAALVGAPFATVIRLSGHYHRDASRRWSVCCPGTSWW